MRNQRAAYLAAVAYIRAADTVRVLEQVARARREPVGLWVNETHWHAVGDASRAMTDAGLSDVRSTWDRRRRRETWH